MAPRRYTCKCKVWNAGSGPPCVWTGALLLVLDERACLQGVGQSGRVGAVFKEQTYKGAWDSPLATFAGVKRGLPGLGPSCPWLQHATLYKRACQRDGGAWETAVKGQPTLTPRTAPVTVQRPVSVQPVKLVPLPNVPPLPPLRN